MTPTASAKVRLDAWLWSVRIYKTRSEATAAVRAGHVRLNGNPVKAAQAVVIGDRIRVRKAGHEFDLEVTQLLSKRVSAQVARAAYVDHAPPRVRTAIPMVPVRDRGAGRPTKKDRRELDRLKSSWAQVDED
ncbi:RNA-binding S4 domain-containing protein [Galactobacter sp.]|uniref:RNA-binding S4 domain-containing protein n=1 Tax=Galactobacter sp. TaxID=2676125 RepID=UPI0025BB2057|nr:RNA-binding S4 domain-containing protein [Galactobacter sp.]